MKKLFIPALLITGLCTFIVISCKEKNNNNITPTYKNQSTGTGANPNINVITVTGTSTVTNPAINNSGLLVGGGGWTYAACASYPMKLVGYNGNTTVEILFGGGTMQSITYAFTSGIPTNGQARMTIYNAPGQPEGITWYSKSGSVSVNTSTLTGTQATFNNVPCLQYSFLFPVVTSSGTLTCI
jgi:hypothetical protein